MTETGTSQFGINDAWLPEGVTLWTQAIYGSIGYVCLRSLHSYTP